MIFLLLLAVACGRGAPEPESCADGEDSCLE